LEAGSPGGSGVVELVGLLSARSDDPEEHRAEKLQKERLIYQLQHHCQEYNSATHNSSPLSYVNLY
jgi:hypothetical protein